MNTVSFPQIDYLARIGLDELPDDIHERLFALHTRQLYKLPFENLDIHLSREIKTDPLSLFNKLIYQVRGGYCFELNELLALALESFGFIVQRHIARVLYNNPWGASGPRTHQILFVTIDGQRWLTDVGFGGPGLRKPIPLIVDQIFEQFGDCFRFQQDGVNTVLQKESHGQWLDLYTFADETTLPVDFIMANHFTSTWPDSPFRKRRWLALAQSWGRITLINFNLTIYRDGNIENIILPPGEDYIQALQQYFGIRLDAQYSDFMSL
ncbi:MAG: arylamine N-acetyltransferase [Gammaproteobacteria bacterium]|nr:arylamine N-acetyltransferase [Gammaproteobacteria bacterium]